MTPVRKPWLHLFWALPSILVFLVVVFYLISNLQGRAVWESVLQELAAKGETIDVDELLGPEPPTESNVARHPFWTSKEAQELTRAAEANSALLKSLPLLPTLKPLDVTSAMKLVGLESSGNEANDIRQLRAFFETMRSPWYVPLQEAISRSEAVWLTNRNFPINSPLISQPLFESSKMLAMLCLFALLDGDQEQAMEGLHSLDRLVDVITVPGSALHHLIASVTLKYMLGTIAYGLEFGMWRTSDLLALDSVLAKKQIRNWMRIVLQSERAILLTSVMYSPSRTFAGGSRSASLEGWLGSILQTMRPSGWDFEDRAFSAMNTQQMIDVLNNDSVLDWSSKIKESEIELDGWLNQVRYPISFAVGDSLKNIAPILGMSETQIHLTRVAIALELAKQQSGEFPSTIEDLQVPDPSLLIDPFSNKPWRYRRDGDRYRLYSVGPNGVDDDGKSNPRMQHSLDWVFR